MGKKKFMLILLVVCFAINSFSQAKHDYLSRAVSYFLLNDNNLAGDNFRKFFSLNIKPSVQKGFSQLLAGSYWEAIRSFENYLQTDYRCFEAMLGVALATYKLKDLMAEENINRILRIVPRYLPAKILQGFFYLDSGDLKKAETSFQEALKISDIEEIRIFLAQTYLQLNDFNNARKYLEPALEQSPNSFYLNILFTKLLISESKLAEAKKYLEKLRALSPRNMEIEKITAYYHYKNGDFKECIATIERIPLNDQDFNLKLLKAEALLKRGKKSEFELLIYELFNENPWHKEVNYLLAKFKIEEKREKNIRFWKNRLQLAGVEAEKIKQIFQSDPLPLIESPFNKIFAIRALKPNLFAVFGIKPQENSQKLYFLDDQNLKELKKVSFQGKFLKAFISPSGSKMVFVTDTGVGEKIYLYAVNIKEKDINVEPLIGYALNHRSITGNFNSEETEFYFIDEQLKNLAFESPFSFMPNIEKTYFLYEKMPFSLYIYSFQNRKLSETNKLSLYRKYQLDELQKYFLVYDNYQSNKQIADLIDRGKKSAITSSFKIKIHFNSLENGFVLVASDSQNPFISTIVDNLTGKVEIVDSISFLSKQDGYAICELIDFSLKRGDLLILIKNDNRELIQFNYKNKTFKKLSSGIRNFLILPADQILLITEKKKAKYFPETQLELINLQKYDKDINRERSDLQSLLILDETIFAISPFGEKVKIDENFNLFIKGFFPEKTFYDISSDRKRLALAINEKLFLIEND